MIKPRKLYHVVYLITKRVFFLIILVFLLVLLIPNKLLIPVKGVDKLSWDKNSFWYYPWGKSITHKGIDIFAEKHTKVIAPTYGIILKVKKTIDGGNVVYMLGPKWITHYFAHLDSIIVKDFQVVCRGEWIATVGNSGNAKYKQPHLHYSLFTFVPYIWNYDEFAIEGNLKMFYLNPGIYFE